MVPCNTCNYNITFGGSWQNVPPSLQILVKCPFAKCPLAKCPLAEHPLAKRPLAKCPLAKWPFC